MKNKIKSMWRKHSPIFKWQISGHHPRSPLVRPIDPWKGSITKGEKSFLSHPKLISDSYWDSFEWLRDLREIGNEKARIVSRSLVDEWHLQNSNWDDKTWSPRLIGNRLSNILFCYGTFADTADNEFQNRLMKQFASQARYLELEWKNFEDDSDRLYALLGLMAGRVCLTKQKDEIDYIIEVIIGEIEKVINTDGMHFSRKPQFQLEVLKIFIEIHYLGKSSIKKVREKYNNILNNLISCSKMLQHSDGSIINFNGGSKFGQNKIAQLVSKSGISVKALSGISEDGFAKLNSKSTSLIFDMGMPNKDTLNWHAGTLSFEFSHGKNLILVNNGFLDIDAKWANALRGTSAHSTISIDGKNSSSLENNKDIERIAEITEKYLENTSKGSFASATHNGYYSSHGIYHKREITLNKQGNKISGMDELIYSGAPGAIALTAELRFHLHPCLKVAKALSGDIILRLKNGSGWLFKLDDLEPNLEDTIFIKENNVLRSQQILVNVPLSKLRSCGSKIIKWEFYKSL